MKSFNTALGVFILPTLVTADFMTNIISFILNNFLDVLLKTAFVPWWLYNNNYYVDSNTNSK